MLLEKIATAAQQAQELQQRSDAEKAAKQAQEAQQRLEVDIKSLNNWVQTKYPDIYPHLKLEVDGTTPYLKGEIGGVPIMFFNNHIQVSKTAYGDQKDQEQLFIKLHSYIELAKLQAKEDEIKFQLEAEVEEYNERLEQANAEAEGDIERRVVEAKAQQWQWPEGSVLKLYRVSWCAALAYSGGEGAEYKSRYSLYPHPLDDGFWEFLPEPQNQKPIARIKIASEALPQVEEKVFHGLADLPYQFLLDQFLEVQVFWFERKCLDYKTRKTEFGEIRKYEIKSDTESHYSLAPLNEEGEKDSIRRQLNPVPIEEIRNRFVV